MPPLRVPEVRVLSKRWGGGGGPVAVAVLPSPRPPWWWPWSRRGVQEGVPETRGEDRGLPPGPPMTAGRRFWDGRSATVTGAQAASHGHEGSPRVNSTNP